MKKHRWPVIFASLNAALLAFVVVAFLNLRYPLVGHDYSLAIPHMLDVSLYMHLNGPGIQWYTPTFGGGLPVFPDPNSAQYSLPVFLTLFLLPWDAVLVSTAFFVVAGFAASVYLFARVLKLHWTTSLLGAVFFSANGFVLERMAAGHLGYQTLPLVAFFFILLLDETLPRWVAALCFSLLVALLIYQAGYFLIIAFGLSLLILLPMAYIHKPVLFSWKRVLTVILLGGGVGLILASAKIASAFAFMRYFPRQVSDTYSVGWGSGLLGLLFQLLGMMNLAPLLWLTGIDPTRLADFMVALTGGQYGYWEFDMSLSPVVFILLLTGGYSLLRKPKQYAHLFKPDRKWLAWVLLLLAVWLAVEFTLAKGLFYPLLRNLPILSSLHVNARFAMAFLLPLGMAAALVYDHWVSGWNGRKAAMIFGVVNVLALLPLLSYFLVDGDLQDRSYDISTSIEISRAIRSGDDLEITAIRSWTDNTDALALHTSNLGPYAPIFGYKLENFHPEIVPGSVWTISDGYYNMTNPSGYVYPELNDTRPFERIRVDDEANLAAFVAHRETGWKIPVYQRILNWLSGLSVVTVILMLSLYFIRKTALHRRIPDGQVADPPPHP